MTFRLEYLIFIVYQIFKVSIKVLIPFIYALYLIDLSKYIQYNFRQY